MAKIPGVDSRWQAEQDLHTVTEAEKIKRDRARFSKVKSLARGQARDLQKIVKTTARKKR